MIFYSCRRYRLLGTPYHTAPPKSSPSFFVRLQLFVQLVTDQIGADVVVPIPLPLSAILILVIGQLPCTRVRQYANLGLLYRSWF
jgi:hypothetical protein